MRAGACMTAGAAAPAEVAGAVAAPAAVAAAPEVAAEAVAAPAAAAADPEAAGAAAPVAASRRPAAVLVALVSRSTLLSPFCRCLV